MANCNSCGRYMRPTENVYKRQLYSGRSSRVYYGKRINFSTSNYYSMKSVCADCAEAIDKKSSLDAKITVRIILILIIVFLLIALFN